MVSRKVQTLLFSAMVALVPVGAARAWEVYRSESGAVLRWDRADVAIGLTPVPASAGFGLPEARGALIGGLGAWRNLGCGGPTVTVDAEVSDGVLDPADEVNRVVWIATREAWTARFPSTELARTILIYRVQSGRLVEADIAVNLAFFEYGASSECDAQRYDLQGLLTHELGHLFGLDHSREPDATMAPDVAPGVCDQRTLSDDDKAGYCASYPLQTEPVVEPGPEPSEVEARPEDVAEAAEAEAAGPDPDTRDDGCRGAPLNGLLSVLGLVGLWLRRCVGRARRCSAR